ncbi:NAD(P)H-binding protein [Microbispora sp. NPDC049125]|uniref:NAD(P)H-binding protein n=1 Tax=Microbispora sp. NPDC049125 TaxID=3154929 RepID=UPI0034654B64
MILVTGATGNVGRNVVSLLAEAGAPVRALARRPGPLGLPEGVEVVRGDLSVPESLAAPLDGVEAVFLVWPLGTAEAAPPVVDAIAARARRVVYLSSMSVREDVERQADPISQFHADIERLVDGSPLEWTFLRPCGFATNTLGWAPQIRAGDVVRWPYAGMARPLIHERDIAAVAARALAEKGHEGAAYGLTGPELISQAEQVRAIGEAVGRPLRFEEMPPGEAREHLVAQGWPPAFAEGALRGWAGLMAAPEPVSGAVEELTGAPPRTFRQWAADHAADFR